MNTLLIGVVLLVNLNSAFGRAGEGAGNGGGGVLFEGKPSTFREAGVNIELKEREDEDFAFSNKQLDYEDIPQIEVLIDFIENNFLSYNYIKGELLKAILPGSDRKYILANKDIYDSDAYLEIYDDYKREFPNKEPIIHAITFPATKKTVLLPTFFELSGTGKMAILFHEALWLLNSKRTLNKVLYLEDLFHAWLKDSNNLELMYDFFVTLIPGSEVTISLKLDTLGENISFMNYDDDKEPSFKMHTIYGQEFYNCIADAEFPQICQKYIGENVYKLMKENPNSFFLKYLYKKLMKKEVQILKSIKGDYIVETARLARKCLEQNKDSLVHPFTTVDTDWWSSNNMSRVKSNVKTPWSNWFKKYEHEVDCQFKFLRSPELGALRL